MRECGQPGYVVSMGMGSCQGAGTEGNWVHLRLGALPDKYDGRREEHKGSLHWWSTESKLDKNVDSDCTDGEERVM